MNTLNARHVLVQAASRIWTTWTQARSEGQAFSANIYSVINIDRYLANLVSQRNVYR